MNRSFREVLEAIFSPTELFPSSRKMSFAGERYFIVHQFLLTMLGLWPYKRPIVFHTAFVFAALISFVFFQVTTFTTRICTFEFIIRELSFILPAFVYFTLYNIFYFNTEIIKQMFEHIKGDWNMMEKYSEIKVLEKYAFENHLITFIIASLIGFSVFCLILIESVPFVLDVIMPLNKSRPRKLKVDFELFIDEEQYFLVYVVLEIVVVGVAFFTLVSTGLTLLTLMRHCCATYKIASDWLENVVTEETLQIASHQKVHVMCLRINRVVHMHRKSTKYSKFLLERMSIWFFILMLIGVLSLSCNLLRLFHALILLKDFPESLVCFVGTMGHFVAMFLGNLLGESIINHSADIFYATYRTMWYKAPLPIQKLLLFMMQNSIKNDTLIIGGMFVTSLEGFSTLITSSLSYFTVFYSIQ